MKITWGIQTMRVFVLLVLILGLYWIGSIVKNLGPSLYVYEPNLQFISTAAVILILMPLLVLYCSSNTFITKWWDNKGRRLLLISYILIAIGYAISFYWALIVSAL